ncbi:MAG: hypothetical protein V4819_12910 [Verrucomicrobiota bacterium]
MFFSRSSHEIGAIFYPLGTHGNRNWWEHGDRVDAARDSLVDDMSGYEGPVHVWKDLERDVFPILDGMDFDYICLGNGTDPAHKALAQRYGTNKVLFSEYGWLPWSGHFYISRGGAGFDSEIARMDEHDVSRFGIDRDNIESFQGGLPRGADFEYEDFLYVPLQKDVNDFKFLYSRFADNMEFIRFIDGIVPPGVKVLLKCHPLYKQKYDLSFSNRLIDITNDNLDKAALYERMRAMICLNSTSVLEALSYGARVFTYGDDIFVNKGVTYHKVEDQSEFERLLVAEPNPVQCQKFISLLLGRQIDRKKCIRSDSEYIFRHYWNLCLGRSPEECKVIG